MKLNDVAALLISRGGVQGDVIKRSDRVWRGMWARPAARHQTERGAFLRTPPRGLVGAVQMWEGECLLLWEA